MPTLPQDDKTPTAATCNCAGKRAPQCADRDRDEETLFREAQQASKEFGGLKRGKRTDFNKGGDGAEGEVHTMNEGSEEKEKDKGTEQGKEEKKEQEKDTARY
ncbi:hypothetical protein K491DRAFT_719218 [Lophiostoma macrostomum CBS 122681]|uniref:Uncharacterized protein n=1 Tax=Lophiostoma macrostomum CBS 122681 TaxID=1314788 RepID=A0A6A6SWN3_9PLEO|nr:hypothetical protein K491DRAFT_719218 [Lophiostoma macrostomum CBS 122681]